MTIRLTARQTRLLRMKAQRLDAASTKNESSSIAALSALGVTQAQEKQAGILSLRPRASGMTEEDIQRAIQVEHSIVWTWLNRGTLHLVTADDLRWISPLIGPRIAESLLTRLRQLGWEEALLLAGIEVLIDALVGGQELTREELAGIFERARLPYAGQALPNFLGKAALEGVICRGAGLDKKHTYVLLKDWIDGSLEPPSQDGFNRLARRFLEAYGPAGPHDLAVWSGMRVPAARRAFEEISGELEPVQIAMDDHSLVTSWILKTHLDRLDHLEGDPSVVRLVPRFETYLLGYVNRNLIIKRSYLPRIYNGGIINATLIIDGEAVGIWRMEKLKERLEIQVEPFEQLADELLPLLEAEILDIGRFYGLQADGVLLPPRQ